MRRIFHTFLDINYRTNSIALRNSKKWSKLYKKRTVIEKTIANLKDSMSVNNFKLRNTETIKADILLASITQHIGLIITAKFGALDHPLSLKELLA